MTCRDAQRSLTVTIAVLTLGFAAGCAPSKGTTTVDGQGVVPIDPGRPGDALFKEGLDLYTQAELEQAAAVAARGLGDTAEAAAQSTLAIADYGLARAKFDLLRGDPALCPTPSIRCDNAAYLAGRSSYEIGTIPFPNDPLALEDARTRLDAMLADFPSSAFEDSAAYFDGRAHFALTSAFGVGTYADAEFLFERALAANPTGAWADNALYYDGRSEFELALAVAPLAISPAPEYAQARTWLGQAIAALGAVKARFPASSYADNAAYYLGRSWFEMPTPGTVPDPERVGNLNAAISALGPDAADAASYFSPGAHYWRGRAHYALSFHRDLPADKDAESTAARADFHAVASASTWRDNALYYAVKAALRLADTAGACADYLDLATHFPASVYTSRAATTLSTAAITCP